jgi:hypothetical protein
MNIDWTALTHIADRAGVILILLIIILAGMRRWWVWGWTFDECTKREQEWKNLAQHGTNNSDRALDQATRLLELAQMRTGPPPPARRRRVARKQPE